MLQAQTVFDHTKSAIQPTKHRPHLMSPKGLSRKIVEMISAEKNEPEWMLQKRLRALEIFESKPIPTWGPNLSGLNFDEITFYIDPSERRFQTWDEVPAEVKRVYDRIGVPEAEKKFLAGVVAQYESEGLYGSLKEKWAKLGVIFCSMDEAVQRYPDLVKQYFMTRCVPAGDNKFAALHGAVWSGGAFLYVPKGVKLAEPVQTYFFMNAETYGQFEHTLIIIDEGAEGHYIEGCLPGDELVSFGDAFAPIQTVEPGMEVLDSHGNHGKVIATRKSPYTGEMLKITPVSVGNSFELTPNHPVWAIKRERVSKPRTLRPKSRRDILPDKLHATEPRWVDAGDLEVGDIICFPIAQKTVDHPELSDDFLKFLGYYLSEGSAFVNRASGASMITISLHSDEAEKIAEVQNLIEHVVGRRPGLFLRPEKHEARIYICSAKLFALCVKYCGQHASDKKLHVDIMELPAVRQRLLLDSYLKGDGNRSFRGNNVTVRSITTSRQLAFQLQELWARQGIYAGINIRRAYSETLKDGRPIHHNEAYILHFEENRLIQQVWRDDARQCFWVPIRKIDSRPYDGFVYNIEMENEPHAYLAKGFAVHNCTAPHYGRHSLHSAVVEIFVKKSGKARYTTIQNWSTDVYNLNTKRALVEEDGQMEWVGGSLGSGVTMLYPCSMLMGRGAKADHLNIAIAGPGQHKDTGAKVVHGAPDTSSTVLSKSISVGGGISSYRGLTRVVKGAKNAKAKIQCDALLMDNKSEANTWPHLYVYEPEVTIGHEASTSRIEEEQLFYLQSRGLSADQAIAMIVNGFLEPVVRELPLEYAVELNRLIALEMESSVG